MGMRRRPMLFSTVSSLRSVRARSTLAGLALLLLLAAVAGVSLWRAQSDRAARNSLEQRASAVAALESARAQIYSTATFTAISVFVDDPKPFVDQFRQGQAATAKSLQDAHDAMIAAEGSGSSAVIDDLSGQVKTLFANADAIMTAFLTADRDARVAMAQDYQKQAWPEAAAAIAKMQQLEQEQAAKLAAEKAAADSASKNTLALLITFSVAAFLTACAALSMLHVSITRPLTALRASARAVTSGDLEARATESGPEEVASVARDFNEMTQALLNRTEKLVQSEQQFRDVLEVSRDLVYKLNMETRTYDYISPSASDLLGFTPEEVAAMGLAGIRERFHPEDRERFRTFPRDLPEGGDEHRMAQAIEYRWKCRDGEYRWLSDNRAIVRDEDGKVLAVVGTVRDITSRRQAEEALRQSEEKFRSLSASVPVGVYSTDLDGKFIYVNEHLADTHGVRPEELLGRIWSTDIHPDDRRAAVTAALEAGRELRTFSSEHRIVRPDGTTRWIRVASSPLMSAEGTPLNYVGVAEDVTERRRAEDALRESEERFRTLSAAAPVGIFSTDPRGKFIYVNEHLLETYGLRLEETLGRAWTKNIHPDDRQATFEEALKAGREKRKFSWEYRVVTPGGGVRWVRSVASPILSRDGSLVSYVGAAEDVTEQKQADAALRESEERFRTLSASAPIGIFLSDVRGNAVYSNENAWALIGGTSEDGLGHVWNDYIHPDDREAVMAEGAAALADRRKFSMEYRILTKDGEERWVHTTIIAIRSPEGIVTGYLGTIEDVTDRKRAEEEMANRLKMESAVAQASNLLAGSDDADVVLNVALPILAEAFSAERAVVFVARGKDRVDAVSTWRAPGIPKIDNLHDLEIAAFPWLSNKLARGEPVIVPDVSALPPEAGREKEYWEANGNRSMLAFPVTSRGRSIGCVIFHNTKSTRPWRDEDVQLLRLASESISSFFQRRRAAGQRREAYASVVLLLAVAAEARDPYTESHLQRIKGFSEAIASELGLEPQQIKEIGLASLLHDLGKMRVPDAILAKPGPLS
ncbi:MAG: PAS domain S-box protein, partial [Dehalococcoidia bacterium]